MPKFMEPKDLLDALNWRYATKFFDPGKKIPGALWKTLEEALILSPSSYGLQPWKFRLVTDEALRKQLMAVSWNQAQVTDCSHFVVFTARTDITAEDVDRWVARMAQVRGVAKESLKSTVT